MTGIYRIACPIARATGHEFDVTFVTCDNRDTLAIPLMRALARYLDPRRSLASAIGWLMFALSIGLVVVASVWVDDIVRTNLIEQREGQLDSTADRIAAELNLNLALRLQSVRALAALLTTELREENKVTIRRILDNLQQASPEFEWIGAANPQGRVLAATSGVLEGASVADRSWFALGLKGSKIDDARLAPLAAKTPPAAADNAPGPFVDLIASVIDAKGEMLGVIGTQLSSRWLQDLAESLGPESRGSAATEALVLDQEGTVLIGPASYKGKRWKSTLESTDTAAPIVTVNVPRGSVGRPRRVEQLADGRRYLVAQATPRASDALHALGWRVVVLQPLQDATQRARILQVQITAVLLGLGLLAALLGVLLARRVTRGLDAIARSADAVRTGTTQRIAVPSGRNEAARLGRALDELLTSLQRERSALRTLNAELDQRVAARTREIERLADQARYTAVVRERLKIARDLHDTLAHSMMAMLAEIRLLRRLLAANPGAMAGELTRAEETAHQGLKEARAAITQMRFNPVRDAGLTAALDDLVKLFVERSGIPVDYTSDAPAGTFADERAETLFRIAEEAMRNVERHAGASRVTLSLRAPSGGHGLTLTIADDGVGFDAEAAHPGHYGLAGLREQARLIEAILTVHSAPQQGTTISAALALGLDS
jgi:signal transduction histidine kinase